MKFYVKLHLLPIYFAINNHIFFFLFVTKIPSPRHVGGWAGCLGQSRTYPNLQATFQTSPLSQFHNNSPWHLFEVLVCTYLLYIQGYTSKLLYYLKHPNRLSWIKLWLYCFNGKDLLWFYLQYFCNLFIFKCIRSCGHALDPILIQY